MRKILLSSILMVLALFLDSLFAQERKLTPANLAGFLANYDQNFGPLETVYRELENEKLTLRDKEGQLLGRRPVEDRRQALADLRQTARQLAANPQDLVVAAKLVFGTERLADDLFDLSQIAYDNDREELGKRLADLQITMDHNKELLATYLLSLAEEKQQRLRELEKEKQELEHKLKEAAPQSHEKPGQP